MGFINFGTDTELSSSDVTLEASTKANELVSCEWIIIIWTLWLGCPVPTWERSGTQQLMD